VALGMFHVWLPLEGEGEGEREILFNLFSIDFRVLFYHGFKPLLHFLKKISLTYKL
jgi:hypothetical protein